MIFWKIRLPPSGNVNDDGAHIYKKYANLDGKNRTYRPRWRQVVQWN